MTNLASSDYCNTLRQMHERETWGDKGHTYKDEILAWFGQLGCATLLDYGSGKETLRLALAPAIDVQCYDPGTDRNALPSPADFIACTDVLEHIEPELINNVLAHICTLMRKGGYFSIALNADKRRTLPDGRNAHLLVKNSAWWLAKLQQHGLTVAKHDAGRKHLRAWLSVL